MPGTEQLTYLGLLAAPTSQGPRAVAIALAGGEELHHIVDAGLDTSAEPVRDWLWNAGINPDEASAGLPADFLIRELLIPVLADKTLVVHHADLEVSLVDQLVSEMADAGLSVIISGVDLAGPIASVMNGAAPRRAIALQARYEAALATAAITPINHKVRGKVDQTGALTEISVDGPFLKRNWTLEDADDAFFVMTQISHVGPLAAFLIEGGPAQQQLKLLANELGINEKLAA